MDAASTPGPPSLWASSSDPEGHRASVSGDRAVFGVSWRLSWKGLSLLTTVLLLLGSGWISGGQAENLSSPASGTHSQKGNAKPLPPSPSTLISSSKWLRGLCPLVSWFIYLVGWLAHLNLGLSPGSDCDLCHTGHRVLVTTSETTDAPNTCCCDVHVPMSLIPRSLLSRSSCVSCSRL